MLVALLPHACPHPWQAFLVLWRAQELLARVEEAARPFLGKSAKEIDMQVRRLEA